MRSDKQKETSRRNGAKSRGPVTGAGRQRSAQNAAKHHITSKALVIPGESQEELDSHFAAYRERFRPADVVELDLVHNLAFITWRQRRLWRREADLITVAAARKEDEGIECAPSEGWKSLTFTPAVALLHREEANLRRAYDRTLKNLADLQSTRPELPPPSHDRKLQNEPDQQSTPWETTDIRPPQPAPAQLPPLSENGNGFVLSPPEPPPVSPAALAKYHCRQC
ncbi:MAG TPA: hypothetical protein VFL57_22050 [Bryobacteraceae bacterium]|nr:hypothetical protein [Bryobacteraceae bacterium]